MSSVIEVLKKDVASYESLKADNKIIKTLNNEEVCMMHYPQVKEAIVALEQKERLKEEVTYQLDQIIYTDKIKEDIRRSVWKEVLELIQNE